MLSASTGMPLKLLVLAFAMAGSLAAEKSPLDEALALERSGKLKEARNQYHVAADAFRASGDQHNLAIALSSAGWISISLGDYQGAIRDVEQAIKVRQALHEDSGLGAGFNMIGLAYQYLGDYPAALAHYQEALKFDRKLGDLMGEVRRLNNIGNINYFQGRYMTALESYQSALQLVNANASQSWNAWGRRLTTANIATLYQRLGLEEQALELYQQISGKPKEMPASEYAQTLLNEGILYRHLGDPVKALEVYHTSQAVFRTGRYSDGEISTLRNIGIVKAMDLDDLAGAIQAFTAALELSRQSSNNRGVVQANLYLGEVLRRLHRYKEATSHLQAALEAAQAAGLVEEHWKALYARGRIEEQAGSFQTALEDYHAAISIIESVRADIRATSLRNDFLADKRDVYDSLIAFELRQPQPRVDELFHWMERSRARTLQDRVVARTPLIEPRLPLVQAHLPPDTVLIELWLGTQNSTAVWITAAASGIVRYGPGNDLRVHITQLLAAMQMPGDEWKQPSRELGATILAGIPLERHMIVVQDGPLNMPVEVLGIPGSDGLLIEQCDVSYLPSARLIAMPDTRSHRWLLPWSRQLVALGDPPVSPTDTLAQKEQWQPLPASADEVRGIARIIQGRAETHLGADARKTYLLDRRLEGLPLLHLSTHALVDPERPDRSRILLASSSPPNADYLFQYEVENLDLKNVGLVTVSACDTARGKAAGGEGVQGFTQSFLAAGASATITSLWKVADEPTASFMKKFYYALAQGEPKAEALRVAKLSFLRSNSALSSPRYWAAFVLTGDGWTATIRVISWSALLVAGAAALGVITLILWGLAAIRAALRERRKVLRSA
jgi:tetratricopeptide (TPR) repeat protein